MAKRRASLKLTPYALRCLDRLRVVDLPPGAEPRPLNRTINEIVVEVARRRGAAPTLPNLGDAAAEAVRRAG